ncbi:MAG: hypothetical protein KC503_28245 [Myxococcales bacterium]|nr:hypothetical protein [Myxococcales bacterium]
MKRVAASEHRVLSVARALVGQIGADAIEPVLRSSYAMPPKLGSTAMALLEQTLRAGVVLALCRRGGWRRVEHADAEGEVRRGRMWQRHGPPALRFSPMSVQLCRWLAGEALVTSGATLSWRGKPTLGDQLLLYLACDLTLACDVSRRVAVSPAFRRSPLCWLGFPDVLSAGEAPEARELDASSFDPFVAGGDGVVVLEALQDDLVARWTRIERLKGRVRKPSALIALGESQRRVLDLLMDSAERYGRRDICAFVIEASAALMRGPRDPAQWIGNLTRAASLSERQRAREAAGALLAGLERVSSWVEGARGTRFFDDDYALSQLLLRRFEPLGPEGLSRARALRSQLSALDADAADVSAPEQAPS